MTHLRQQGDGSGFGAEVSTARTARRPRSSPESEVWAVLGVSSGRKVVGQHLRGRAEPEHGTSKVVPLYSGPSMAGLRRRTPAEVLSHKWGSTR